MKFTSIFFTASAVYIRGLPQIYKQTSEKYMKFTSIFFTASAVYIRAKRKLHTNERDK